MGQVCHFSLSEAKGLQISRVEKFKDDSSEGTQVDRVLALKLSQAFILAEETFGISDHIQFLDLGQEGRYADFICLVDNFQSVIALLKKLEKFVHPSLTRIGQFTTVFNLILLVHLSISEHLIDTLHEVIEFRVLSQMRVKPLSEVLDQTIHDSATFGL